MRERQLLADVFQRVDVVEDERQEAKPGEEQGKQDRGVPRLAQRLHDVIVAHFGREVKNRKGDERKHGDARDGQELRPVAPQEPAQPAARLLILAGLFQIDRSRHDIPVLKPLLRTRIADVRQHEYFNSLPPRSFLKRLLPERSSN